MITSSRRMEVVLAHFISRFYKEYITALRERRRYQRGATDNDWKLHEGEVVLIKDEVLPRIKWRKGKINV